MHAGARLSGAEHRVGFPMPDLRAGLGRQGARRDRPFAGQPPPAVVAAVAFAALLAGAAQVVVQRAAALVGRDVAVDGSWLISSSWSARSRPAICSDSSLAATAPGSGRNPPWQTAECAGRGSAVLGVPLRERRPVTPVAGRAVVAHLPRNGTPMAPEHAGDRDGEKATVAQQSQGVSFLRGDLVIRHHGVPALGRDGNLWYRQVTFFVGHGIALTI